MFEINYLNRMMGPSQAYFVVLVTLLALGLLFILKTIDYTYDQLLHVFIKQIQSEIESTEKLGCQTTNLYTGIKRMKDIVKPIPKFVQQVETADQIIMVELMERQRIYAGVACQFAPPQLVCWYLKTKSEIKPYAQVVDCVIVFIDIVSFTQISEGMSLSVLMDVLSTFYKVVIDATQRCCGIVSEFLGDGALLIFTTEDVQLEIQEPKSVVKHYELHLAANNAARCICDIQNTLAAVELDIKTTQHVIRNLMINSGSNLGSCLLGVFGQQRMVYTALGDVVNTAARIEQATRVFNVRNLISESLRSYLDPLMRVRALGQIQAKGKQLPIQVFELLGTSVEAEEKYQIDQKILGLMEQGDYDLAENAAEEAFRQSNDEVWQKRAAEARLASAGW